MRKALIVTSRWMQKELWEQILREEIGTLYDDLDIRWETLNPTGAYQEAHYKNITEFFGSPDEMREKIGDVEILIVGGAPVPDGAL